MTREELRREYELDCDRAIAHPFIVGSDTVARAKALRELVATDDASVDKLMNIMNAQRTKTMTAKEMAASAGVGRDQLRTILRSILAFVTPIAGFLHIPFVMVGIAILSAAVNNDEEWAAICDALGLP